MFILLVQNLSHAYQVQCNIDNNNTNNSQSNDIITTTTNNNSNNNENNNNNINNNNNNNNSDENKNKMMMIKIKNVKSCYKFTPHSPQITVVVTSLRCNNF